MSENTTTIRPLNPQQCLEDLRPQIANYDWMWRILRARVAVRRVLSSKPAKSGDFPCWWHIALSRLANPRRPYFIGVTCSGLRFVGDQRDLESAMWAVSRTGGIDGGMVLDVILAQLRGRAGAYVDVGANMGMMAVAVAHQDPGRQVVAFEPVPHTARRAAATFALNGLQNARLFPVALGAETGELTIHLDPWHLATASAIDSAQEGRGIKVTVPCRPLDDFLCSTLSGPVAFVKIDVEGFEQQVIRGAARLLREHQPVVLYEYNDQSRAAGWTAAQVNHLIDQAGPYRYQLVRPDGTLTELTAEMAARPAVGQGDMLCVPA